MSEKKTAVSSIKESHDDDSKDHLQPMLEVEAQQNPISTSTAPWSIQGAALTEDVRWELFFDIYDSFLIAIAIGLLVKTSLCVYAYKVDSVNRGLTLDAVSPLTTNLIRFNEQLITAFTIVFVTVMTTVTRRYALYKAQKGAYIADLEQLQASISLPSTLKLVFSLQQFTKTSVLLVIFWSFYYTGSQASKREYALVFGDKAQTLIGAYPKPEAAFVNFDTSTWQAGSINDFVEVFRSSGGKADKITSYGVDLDGEMQLPLPREYNLYRNGTVNNTLTANIRPFETSYDLVGRPLLVGSNVTQPYWGDDHPNTTISYTIWKSPRIKGKYDLQTSFIKLDCTSVDFLPATQFPSGVVNTLSQSLNVTELPGSANSSARQLQFWQRWGANETLSGYPVPTINGSQPAALKFTCDLLQPQIKVHVQCSETACLATRAEFPQIDPALLRTTPFSNLTFSTSFFDTMLLAEGIPKARNESHYISNWLTPAFDADDCAALANGTIDPEIRDGKLASQSMWLATAINAYLNVIIKANSLSFTEAYGELAIEQTSGVPSPPPHSDIFKLKAVLWDPHYRLYWQWVAIDFIAGALLLAASIFSFWLRKQTLAPDIFGFVSSLTRDNPHFPVPVGGSTLDGLSRTRALRSMKVKIADISGPHDGHGRLGFVPVQPVIPTETLKKNRKYV